MVQSSENNLFRYYKIPEIVNGLFGDRLYARVGQTKMVEMIVDSKHVKAQYRVTCNDPSLFWIPCITGSPVKINAVKNTFYANLIVERIPAYAAMIQLLQDQTQQPCTLKELALTLGNPSLAKEKLYMLKNSAVLSNIYLLNSYSDLSNKLIAYRVASRVDSLLNHITWRDSLCSKEQYNSLLKDYLFNLSKRLKKHKELAQLEIKLNYYDLSNLAYVCYEMISGMIFPFPPVNEISI
ncbi:hypothetical protein [Lactobacillus crispatus]|uniref:hypothetical protein n=1 Tax=Lactobacillus crispatus TaxID=47770 RepID=UPI0030F5B566